jgi:hypothetical protein
MKTSKKSISKKARVRATPTHRSFRLTKGKLKPSRKMSSAMKLLRQTTGIVKRNPRPFTFLVVISLVLSLVFVKGLGSPFEITQTKQDINDLFGDNPSKVGTSLALFGYLLGSAGSGTTALSGAYQLFLTIVISLATIWLVRQLLADEKPASKDAFYKGMYPLIPFILVVVVILLQLLPMLLGNLLFSTVISNGLAVTGIEKILWFLLFMCLSLLSLYMVTSSLFAAYIVTLPDMTPLKALRSARELVLHRRLGVWLRIIFLPVVLLIISAVIAIPLLIVAPPIIAQLLFLIIGAGSLVIFHTYMYLLYRSLL